MVDSICQFLIHQDKQSAPDTPRLTATNSLIRTKIADLFSNMDVTTLDSEGRQVTFGILVNLIKYSSENFLTFFYIERILNSIFKGVEFPTYSPEEKILSLKVIESQIKKSDRSSLRNVPMIIETALLDLRKSINSYNENPSEQLYEKLLSNTI